MALALETIALLKAARYLADELPADAVLLLTETNLDWEAVFELLAADRLLIAAQDRELTQKLQSNKRLTVLDIDPGPTPTQERMSLALLEAVALEKLKPGAHVVALYNGIGVEADRPQPIDSLSLIHLGEHLERLSAADLRKLDTQVPLETLRAVVELATEIGREGREGKPVGTMLVIGDTKKVLSMSRPLNFNPFRGYSATERDIRDKKVREQIKDTGPTGRSNPHPAGRRGRCGLHVHRRPGGGDYPEQGPGDTPLGRRRHQQKDQGHRRRRQPVVGQCPHIPERHGDVADRALRAPDDLAALPHGRQRRRGLDQRPSGGLN